jgi:hypothetical protein
METKEATGNAFESWLLMYGRILDHKENRGSGRRIKHTYLVSTSKAEASVVCYSGTWLGQQLVCRSVMNYQSRGQIVTLIRSLQDSRSLEVYRLETG